MCLFNYIKLLILGKYYAVVTYIWHTGFHTTSVSACATATGSELSNCIFDLSDWMISHRLKLNQDKSEFLWLGTGVSTCDYRTVDLCSFSQTVWSEPQMKPAVLELLLTWSWAWSARLRWSAVRASSNLGSYAVSVILLISTAALIRAFITGRLDYGNGLLAGVPRVMTDVYQNVQNAAARLLAGHGRRQHGLQVMRDELHWLRVTDRININFVYSCTRHCMVSGQITCLNFVFPHPVSATDHIWDPRTKVILLCRESDLRDMVSGHLPTLRHASGTPITNWPERLQLVAFCF